MTWVLSTRDWLVAHPGPGDPLRGGNLDEQERQVGLLAVLSASLEYADALRPPRPALYCALDDALRVLPPQAATRSTDDAVLQWLNVIAIAELAAGPTLARLMVDRVIALLSAERRVRAGTRPSVEQREAMALCWARRGRIVRVAGQLDDAEASYRSAVAGCARMAWRDARPHAEMGLAATAFGRGNLPAVEQHLDTLLGKRPPVHPLYRIQAHQLYIMVKRRRGQLLDALLHGWHAYDLLTAEDARRRELVVAMADIALEYGDTKAATRGYQTAATSDVPLRIRIPALAGLVRATIAGSTVVTSDTHAWARHALEEAVHASVPPSEEVLAALALAEALIAESHTMAAPNSRALRASGAMVGNDRAADAAQRAHRWLDHAERLCQAHGFHEKQHAVETARESLRGVVLASPHAVPRTRGHAPFDGAAHGSVAHPALARLAALPTLGSE